MSVPEVTHMKEYLSFGAGVNSVALYLLLQEKGIDFEAVFVNHETDLPETYEYVEYLRRNGFEITEIKPNNKGFSSLYEYCKHYKFLPSIYLRWCTSKFKTRPFYKFVTTPCVVHIGFSAEETHRFLDKRQKDVTYRYLLVEEGLNRRDCVQLIKDAGLRVPPKSGCYICPFQSKHQLRKLYRKHPELFEKIIELEKIRGNAHTLKELPIQYYVAYNNHELTKFLKPKQKVEIPNV
jgi:3'-phosphoadenosine 5'-phosphosulfate sulfotransferase (PAPS reductase)/FAD synthetase